MEKSRKLKHQTLDSGAVNINNISYWESHLLNDIDGLVVGGGIVGLSCALALKTKQPEARIVVIDRGNWPCGASVKNAGFACFGSVSEILDDAKTHTDDQLIELIRKRADGLTRLKSIVTPEAMGFQGHGGYEHFLTHQADLYERCFDQLHWANKLAQEALRTNEPVFAPIDNVFGFEGIMAQGILNRFEGQIHTGRLMEALSTKAAALGIQFIGGVNAVAHERQDSRVLLHTQSHGVIETKKLFLATNGYTQDYQSDLVTPARAQALITQPIPGLKIKGTFHLDQGYYYFRNIDQRILLGGGRNLDFEGEKTTLEQTTLKIQNALEDLLQQVILPKQKVEIAQRWSGIMGVGAQKKPIIKQLEPRVYCGVRLGGMGVAIGAEVGQNLAELATVET